MTNRLADTTSPYLLQHADNPVDWYPWGDEAFATARERDVPIFLSVGYSSCHWCHVMAHESFEDDQVAALMNERFVDVKVDREERPDVDAVYMQAVQAMTGRGGWPMSVFLTPDGRPFYAGTYWPREPVHGLPSFPQVLVAVSEAWQDRRDEVIGSVEEIGRALEGSGQPPAADALDTDAADEAAALVLERAWDRQLGGFGRAPKFPQAMTVEWLLHRHARTGDPDGLAAGVQALDAMARGGIHDQLAGGFARYSTDARWLVPHFEKMLYDNALLLAAYATAAALTEGRELARVARSTADFLLGDMRMEGGAFVAAFDADSEGVEGRYYVWSHEDLVDALKEMDVEVERWTAFLGATPQGNWEGANVLHEPVPRERFAREAGLDPDAFELEWERVRLGLLEQRADRVPPGVDDKVLADWNGLAVRGLVRAGVLLDEPAWVAAGAAAATFVHDHLVAAGRLQHAWKDGRTSADGFLDDHAAMALADLELFAATGEPVWFERGLWLATQVQERFHDHDEGGWFQTPEDGERLYTRPKQRWDDATPAGTSMMAEVCLVLAGLTGESVWHERAEEGLRLLQEGARAMPTGYGWTLRLMEGLAAGPRELAVVGRPGAARDALLRVAAGRPRPGTVVVVSDPDHGDGVPLLAGRGEIGGRPAAYVCRDLACELPVTTPDELTRLLAEAT